MRTGAGLALICAGAILAFAVTANTSVLNLHIAGWIILIVGIVGLFIPRRTYGWLGRRLVRRTRTYRGGQVEEVAVRPYMSYHQGLPAAEEPAAPSEDTAVIEDIYES